MNTNEENTIRIPGFTLIEKFDGGGFGEVYRAKELSSFQDQVAIKIIHPHPFIEAKKSNERFNREAEALHRLNHGGIVKYRASGFTDDNPPRPYLVMDFIEGSTIRDIVNSLPFERRISIMIEVLDALQYAHDNSVLHRDIKPSNLMLRTSDDKVIIVDFGSAYVYDGISSETLTTHYIGSLGYIPSEVQVDPSNRSTRHDIFSCGVTLYEICAGHKPNPQAYQPLYEISEQFINLDVIIKKAIDTYEKRFQSTKEFADQLRDWLDISLRRSTNLVSNPQIAKIRKQLLDRKNEREKIESERQQAKTRIETLWSDKHNFILLAAKDAFKEIANGMIDIFPKITFNEQDNSQINDTELLIITQCKENHRIVFGLTSEQTRTKENYMLPSLDGTLLFQVTKQRYAGQKTIPSFKYIMPAWVLFTKSDARTPKKRLYAGLALVNSQQPKLIARNIDEPGHGISPNRGIPFEINTYDEIKEYLLKGLGLILNDIV